MTAEDRNQEFFISPGRLSQAADEMKAWEQKLLKDIQTAEKGLIEPNPDDPIWITGSNLITDQGKSDYVFENVLFASVASASHKLERILKDIASKEASRYLMAGRIIRFDDASSEEVAALFMALGSPLDKFPSFGRVKFMQDVSNMFKHGTGTSSKRLFRNSRELFDDEVILPTRRTRERIMKVLSSATSDPFADLTSSKLSFRKTGDPQSFKLDTEMASDLISAATSLLFEMKMAADEAAILQIVR